MSNELSFEELKSLHGRKCIFTAAFDGLPICATIDHSACYVKSMEYIFFHLEHGGKVYTYIARDFAHSYAKRMFLIDDFKVLPKMKNLEELKVGDYIRRDYEGGKRKILAISGEVFFVSSPGDEIEYKGGFTLPELIKCGYSVSE